MTATIARLFAARVQTSPDATALLCNGATLSYAQLDAASNRFARYLRRHGAGPEAVVGLQVGHGLPAFIALLGIVKAGAAYVALPPAADPMSRTRDLLADSGAVVLVTDQTPAARRGLAITTIHVADDRPLVERESDTPLPALAEPRNLFQIVYTSGSTGRPKGVLVPMTAMLNRLAAMRTRLPFRPDDVALVHRPLSIIGSSWDCFGPLLSGVPALIVADFDPSASGVWRQLRDSRVSYVAAAPSMWELILEQAGRHPREWTSLRLAIVGGQAVTVDFVRRWKAAFPGGVLLNVYGATECVYPTAYEAIESGDAADRVPAGSAFPHVQVHVVDDRLHRVPCGTEGEVCIGGACLARGYLNDAPLTADRFVPDPFGAEPGAVLFRTGDVGFSTPDGVLHVAGRRDRQVKVHGVRVDLGDVESALLACARVASAAVVAVSDEQGDRQLVAYVVTTDAAPLSVQHVRGALGAVVPPSMLPSAVVTLPEMPLTGSGKVDYPRLPQPMRARAAPQARSAAPSITETLTRIWQDALGTAAAVAPDDNFFDLGGDSLAAMRIAARIRDGLHVEIDVSLILDAHTVANLAALMSTSRGAAVRGCQAPDGAMERAVGA